MPAWIKNMHGVASRNPRRYRTIDDAVARMKERNGFLNSEQALHLTLHGIAQNEDGTYSWKFDNYSRVIAPNRFSLDEVTGLWSRIASPMLLINGRESWLEDPETNGALGYFKQAKVISFEGAGHWPHHDKFDDYIGAVRGFLGVGPESA
jgi:pimeloyl-ACP methyl ester carboxylesterase